MVLKLKNEKLIETEKSINKRPEVHTYCIVCNCLVPDYYHQEHLYCLAICYLQFQLTHCV